MTHLFKQDIEEIREQLAEIEHQRWADWQTWCHKILRENCPSPELEKVLERWDRQIATPYKDLTETEKDSDREQVDRYLPLIHKACNQSRIDELEKFKFNRSMDKGEIELVNNRIKELRTKQGEDR